MCILSCSEAKENGDKDKKPPKPHLKDIVRLVRVHIINQLTMPIYVTIYQFRYATPLDYLLMSIGSITGIIHGVSLPLLMLFFGELINFFVYQEQTTVVASCLNISSSSCSNLFLRDPNITLPCGLDSNNTFTLDKAVEDIFGGDITQCLTDDDFTDEIHLYGIYFTLLGFGVFLMAYLEISFFQMACERQVKKIRLFFYRAVLRQNIGWFDSNPSGELASRLNE